MSQCGAFFIGASTPDTARTGAGLYGGAIHMKGLAASIRMLSRVDGGLVIDATGLTGKYRVKLWVTASTAPEVVVAPAASVPLDAAPMVFDALPDNSVSSSNQQRSTAACSSSITSSGRRKLMLF